MKIICDACGAKYSIADEKVSGKTFKIRCKKCSNIIIVRGAAVAAEASNEGAEDVWHLVIDQEQVGPMSVAGVSERFDRGEIDVSSYVWREGFDDWERISDVPEFAELIARSAPSPEAPAAAPEPAAVVEQASPVQATESEVPSERASSQPEQEAENASESSSGESSDLFGSSEPAPSNGLGDELFGGGDSAPAASASSGLFGDSPTPASESAMAASAPVSAASTGGSLGGDVTPAGGSLQIETTNLKGQRNESSVLFSLNNLAALAGDAPAAEAAPAHGTTEGATTEASGLIDIRSMAQVYLGDAGTAKADADATDMPVFSQTSFESAVPVLLPNQSESSGSKKLMVILVASIAVLAVIVGVLGFMAFGDNGAGDAAQSAAGGAENGDAGAPNKGAEPQKVAAVLPGQEDGADDKPDTGNTDTPVEPAPTPDNGTTAIRDSTDSQKTRDKRANGRDDKRTRSNDPVPDPRVEEKPKPPVERASKSPKDNGGDCDEVACLVDSNRACCKRFKNGGSSRDSGGSRVNTNLPERLNRNDIKSGMGGIRARVASCGAKNNFKGRVDTKIKIGGDGRVKSAAAKGGSGKVNGCISSAVKSAKFPKTQTGASFSYPFIL